MSRNTRIAAVGVPIVLVLAFLVIRAQGSSPSTAAAGTTASPTASPTATPAATGGSTAPGTTTSRSSTTVARASTTRPGSHGSSTSVDPTSCVAGSPTTVAASSLPREARTTLALIAAGGPFPYSQDGVVFQNREQVLPAHKSGYYHEYTVVTPGSSDRGARRIVRGICGDEWYTDDHYAHFALVLTDR